MIQNQYQLKYISTNATTVIAASGNLTLHTVSIPVATTGTITLQDKDGSAYFVFPIGAVGPFRFDCICANGLSVVTSASDKVVFTYQTP